MPKTTKRESERRSFGSCERLEHQVCWELDYSGYIEQLAEESPARRARQFDAFWEALGKVVRSRVLREAALLSKREAA